ncbi:hypothetical protein VPH35_036656 [Triticum aestivum]|uniref:Ribonucleoside-diphosphate reductase large subunit n=1 Tax=Aegilops tauschii TaxID=37682 RepID=M8BKQ4_AEGTA
MQSTGEGRCSGTISDVYCEFGPNGLGATAYELIAAWVDVVPGRRMRGSMSSLLSARSASPTQREDQTGSTQFLDPGLSRGHRANPRCRRHDLLVATPRGADDLCPLRLQADTVHFGANTRCRTGTHTMALKVFRRACDTACCVDQGGGKRKGAFAIYLEPWHADIYEFLDLRKNHRKLFKCSIYACSLYIVRGSFSWHFGKTESLFVDRISTFNLMPVRTQTIMMHRVLD